jgi:hypothetical protein
MSEIYQLVAVPVEQLGSPALTGAILESIFLVDHLTVESRYGTSAEECVWQHIARQTRQCGASVGYQNVRRLWHLVWAEERCSVLLVRIEASTSTEKLQVSNH